MHFRDALAREFWAEESFVTLKEEERLRTGNLEDLGEELALQGLEKRRRNNEDQDRGLLDPVPLGET